MSNKKTVTFDGFISLLKELDDRLNELDSAIEIKAIGGFSAIYHAKENNVLGRQESSDIDDLNELAEETKRIIAEIGKKHKVEEDWLNNDWIDIKGAEELESVSSWIDLSEYAFHNIILKILDINSLFLFKIRAIEEKIESTLEPPRQQDIRDILMILKILDEDDIMNLDDPLLRSYVDSYPMARDYISGRELL